MQPLEMEVSRENLQLYVDVPSHQHDLHTGISGNYYVGKHVIGFARNGAMAIFYPGKDKGRDLWHLRSIDRERYLGLLASAIVVVDDDDRLTQVLCRVNNINGGGGVSIDRELLAKHIRTPHDLASLLTPQIDYPRDETIKEEVRAIVDQNHVRFFYGALQEQWTPDYILRIDPFKTFEFLSRHDFAATYKVFLGETEGSYDMTTVEPLFDTASEPLYVIDGEQKPVLVKQATARPEPAGGLQIPVWLGKELAGE